MKSFESPLPPTHFLSQETATIFGELYIRGDRGLADLRQWVREGLVSPAGVIGRPSRTAPNVFGIKEIFTAAVLLALGDLGINERAVLGEVVGTFERDLGGETQIEHIWHAITGPIREYWLMRVDVVRPEPGHRVIEVHVFDGSTPQQFWPDVPIGKYSGSLFVDLSHIANNVEAGIAKVLAASVEGED